MNFILHLVHLFRPLYSPFLPMLRRRLVSDFEYGRLSFSQDGEDLVLQSFFEATPPIARFYVDVGAYHPKRLSNTYFCYRRGWRGINIDAMPGSMKAFEQDRPRDINVEAAVSATPQILTYHMFKEQGLNTLDDEVASNRRKSVGNPLCQLIGTSRIKTCTLTGILDQKLPPGQQIAFLNIDVEGLDLDVLMSLDFMKYSPQYILAEHKPLTESEEDKKSAIADFLSKLGYRIVGKTHRTSIFLLESLAQRKKTDNQQP